MTRKSFIMQKKPIALTDVEIIKQSDIQKLNGSSIRHMVWAYVEDDAPIPNELKSSLFDILRQGFKGKSKADTAAFWQIRVYEIVLLTLGVYTSADGETVLDKDKIMNVGDAINQVATNHNQDVSTVERQYRSGKYSSFKHAIKSTFKEPLQDSNDSA